MSPSNPLEKEVNPTSTIDAKGLLSPIPLLRLKKELAILRAEEIVQIDSTDSGTGNDIASWCSKTKYAYLGEKRNVGFTSYFVMKK